MATLKPLINNVAIARDPESTITAGGIHLSDFSEEASQWGTVKRSGPGRYTSKCTFIENELLSGDRVIFPIGAGYYTEVDGEELWLMLDTDVWARSRRDDEPEGFPIVPIFARLIVKPDEPKEQVTESGFTLVSFAPERPTSGEVVAVGEGKFSELGVREPMEVQVGERVQFSELSGVEFNVNGTTYLVLNEHDVKGRM